MTSAPPAAAAPPRNRVATATAIPNTFFFIFFSPLTKDELSPCLLYRVSRLVT
jgi:hypothetical protein